MCCDVLQAVGAYTFKFYITDDSTRMFAAGFNKVYRTVKSKDYSERVKK